MDEELSSLLGNSILDYKVGDTYTNVVSDADGLLLLSSTIIVIIGMIKIC